MTKILISWEKERPIGQEGASGKALDPQGNHKTIFRPTSQVAKDEV